MFSNAGKKLGTIIKIFTVINMVATFIVILIFAIELFHYNPMVGCIFGVIGGAFVAFLEWLGALFMIGLCDMMADVRAIRQTLENNR